MEASDVIMFPIYEKSRVVVFRPTFFFKCQIRLKSSGIKYSFLKLTVLIELSTDGGWGVQRPTKRAIHLLFTVV